MSERPIGERFSKIYLEPAAYCDDSLKARFRLGSIIYHISDDAHDMAAYLRQKIGDIGYPSYETEWTDLFCKLSLIDFLDALTICARFLLGNGDSQIKLRANSIWIKSIAEVFSDERLDYEIDDHGGVHRRVDSIHAEHRREVLLGLQGAQYENVRSLFESCNRAMNQSPPDMITAITSIFRANEGAFRMIYPGANRLDSAQIKQFLSNNIQLIYSDQAKHAALRQAAAFAEWTNSCHQYRHEQGHEKPISPPFDLAVSLISSGYSYLRWLVSMYSGQSKN